MSKWEPIETAPRDGTPFLSVIWFDTDEGSYPEYVVLQWDMLEGEGWCDQSGFIVEDILPTEWQPINPPKLLSHEGVQS